MNIDEMQAGREMDALIAEKVMGISVQLFGDGCYLLNYCIKKENGDLYYFKGECPLRKNKEEAGELIPQFSTDITAAWEVANKMRIDGFELSLNDYLSKGYHVFFAGIKKYATAVAETAPLAICRAALKALEPTS